MSSYDAIRDLDADMLDAFAESSFMGDTGTYTDSTQSAVPVTVMIDRAVQRVGEYGQVVGTDLQVGVQLREMTPARGGKITVGSETFTLDRRAEGDTSVEWWSVTT